MFQLMSIKEKKRMQVRVKENERTEQRAWTAGQILNALIRCADAAALCNIIIGDLVQEIKRYYSSGSCGLGGRKAAAGTEKEADVRLHQQAAAAKPHDTGSATGYTEETRRC